jgi:hypothetical protein
MAALVQQPYFRLRTRGKFDTSAVTEQQSLNSGCAQTAWTTIGTQQLPGIGTVETMGDWVVPGYHHLIQQGSVFFNPMYRTKHTASRSVGNGTHRQSTSSINCSGDIRFLQSRDIGNEVEVLYQVAAGLGFSAARTFIPPQLLQWNEISPLITQLSTKVQSDRGRSAQDLWEDLAEVDKSLSILHDLYRSIASVISSFRARNIAASAAELWLMYRYGIKPLVQDAAGVYEGLKKKVGRRRITSRARDSVSRQNTRTVVYTAGDQIVNISEFTSDTVEIRVMSLDEYNATLLFNVGFSPKSILTLPWELVKYSFVVDWFANAGDFIGAMVPAFGFSQLGSCTVIKRSSQLQFAAIGNVPTSGWTVVAPCQGSFNTIIESTQRSTGLASPGLGLKNDFRLSNLTRLLDASSLVIQRLTH